jgi:hypothetical protein
LLFIIAVDDTAHRAFGIGSTLGARELHVAHSNSDKQSDLLLSTEEGLAPILALAVFVILGLIAFHLHPDATMTPTAKIATFSHMSLVDKARIQ